MRLLLLHLSMLRQKRKKMPIEDIAMAPNPVLLVSAFQCSVGDPKVLNKQIFLTKSCLYPGLFNVMLLCMNYRALWKSRPLLPFLRALLKVHLFLQCDVKDSFFMVDQVTPMADSLLGRTYKVKKNLPGQRLGARA